MMLRLSGPKASALFATTFGIGLATIAPASAQVKLSENFETGFTPGGYSGGDTAGSVTGYSSTNVAGVGVGGSRGGQVQATFNPGGVNQYAQMAIQVFKANTATATTDLSRLFVDFDIRFSSTAGPGTSFNVVAQSFGTVQGDLNRNQIPLAPSASFTHFQLPLSSFTPSGTNAFDPNAANIQFNFVFTTYNNGFQQSPSATHTAVIDNVVLTAVAVPEPGTIALLGMGIAPLGLVLRRRRAS